MLDQNFIEKKKTKKKTQKTYFLFWNILTFQSKRVWISISCRRGWSKGVGLTKVNDRIVKQSQRSRVMMLSSKYVRHYDSYTTYNLCMENTTFDPHIMSISLNVILWQTPTLLLWVRDVIRFD